MTFRDFVGKTIASVDTSCVNVVIFTFTDGTTADVYAECGTGRGAIPFLYVEDGSTED